jgi:phosphoglycerate dehydrogenase-like enzyme
MPLTDRTRGVIAREELRILGKRRAFLSNISRGEVVDTDALIDALEGGVLSGAAVDVTDPEPLPDGHRVWGTRNLIITPHVSGQSTSYADRASAVLEANLVRYSEGRELMNVVSRRDGY